MRSARPVRGWQITAASLALLGLAVWALRHGYTLLSARHGHQSEFETIFVFSFIMLCWQFSLYAFERPATVNSPRKQRLLDELNVVAVVPVFNEAPMLLADCIESIITQDRKVQRIIVVDDGTADPELVRDYAWIISELEPMASTFQVELTWLNKANGGKRSAQALAIEASPEAAIYVTVDSDSILDHHAVGELLKPFADQRVHSVAGVVMAANSTKNFLTRFTDLWFVVGQLTDRSSMSRMGSVLVNSGALAGYRAGIIRDNLGSYLTETFAGRRVEFSDDSMLTIYALAIGRAVQQPTAFAFTAMPENFSHHLRQYTRWMRGAFIRSFWRLRYLPVDRYAYWSHVIAWLQTLLAWTIAIVLFVVAPALGDRYPWELFAVPVLVGYAQALRYFTIRRSDVSFKSQLATYALVPVAWLWGYLGLRLVRWYAIATVLNTGWGTRQKGVEVSITPAAHDARV